jgi:hypothetical protein
LQGGEETRNDRCCTKKDVETAAGEREGPKTTSKWVKKRSYFRHDTENPKKALSGEVQHVSALMRESPIVCRRVREAISRVILQLFRVVRLLAQRTCELGRAWEDE